MQIIDFSTIQGIYDKISAGEITKLNEIFQSPEVIAKLEEIEAFRKKRLRFFGYITLFMVIITLLIGYFIGKTVAIITGSIFAIILAGIFFRVGTGDNSFSTIEGIGIIGTFLYGGTYAAFRSKIEIPLKRDIMSRICKTLYGTFEYSYDGKYSFNDLELLLQKKFLNSYNRLETVEDSCALKVEQNGKLFFLNGFELKTRRVSGSGKNRRNVVTNHDYLMKIVFPHARIPLPSEVIIEKDRHESKFFLFRSWGFFKKKRVLLEDIEFEKMYDVRCDDEVSSRMILTPIFMEKLVNFTKKTGNQYSFLFTNNTVYIKRKIIKKYMEVGTRRNMFENMKGFLDFYIDLREVLLLSSELHFLYLSQTKQQILENSIPENIPVPFLELQGFARFFGFGKKLEK